MSARRIWVVVLVVERVLQLALFFRCLRSVLGRRRREILLPAFRSAGFTVDHSQAGLYLWVTHDEACRDTVGWLAQRGILAAPGEFYGPRGSRHVRVALTATDERIAAAVDRLNQ